MRLSPLLVLENMSNKVRELVNSKFTIREAFELATGHTPPQGKCFCPFHHNVKTPAAKVYQTRMVCFGECHRSYDAYDFLSTFRKDLIEEVKGATVMYGAPVRRSKQDVVIPKASSVKELIKNWLAWK